MSTTQTQGAYQAQPCAYNPDLWVVVDTRQGGSTPLPVALMRRGGRPAAQAVANGLNQAHEQAAATRRGVTLPPCDPHQEVLVYCVATRGTYATQAGDRSYRVQSSYTAYYAATSPDDALRQAHEGWNYSPEGLHRVYFSGPSYNALRRAAHPGRRPMLNEEHLAMRRWMQAHAMVYDDQGKAMYVGGQVVAPNGDVGLIQAITEPDGDMDEYNRQVGINPTVVVRWGDGFVEPYAEERLATFAEVDGPGHDPRYVCEDVEVRGA